LDLYGAQTGYHGDESYGARLEPLLNAHGVRLRGPIAHEDVPHVLASLDVLVVPSIWPENSPFVIREAFLAGVPVVASRIGGIPQTVVDGVNGLLVEPGTADSLHRALARLVDEPALLESLRARIPAVRTLAEDVAQTRAFVAKHVGQRTSATRAR